jgi:hypothetical protein
MRASDIRRKQQVKLKIEYLSEDVLPEPGKAEPVIVGGEEFAKVEKWRVNRVFYFLTGSSIACLTVAALVPNPAVQGTAIAIWAGSVGLAKILLADAYRKSGATKKTK